MAYRILIDENTSPRVATRLEHLGHEAHHVCEILGEGIPDEQISKFARENGYVVLTHDPDFFDPELHRGAHILYYADDRMSNSEIINRIEEVIRYVPDPQALPAIMNIGEWG